MFNDDRPEWDGNWQGGRLTCNDCIHCPFATQRDHNKFKMGETTCNLLQDKYNIDIIISEKSNICKNFEKKEHLKFRITDKIDSKTGKWSFDDYLDFLLNEWYDGLSNIPYEPELEGVDLTGLDYKNQQFKNTYLPNFKSPTGFMAWKVVEGEFITVHNIKANVLLPWFEHVKIGDVTYYVLYEDWMNQDFINENGEIEYYVRHEKISNRKTETIRKYGECGKEKVVNSA